MLLKSGSTGKDVMVMERQLNAAGYNCPVTGIYDAAIATVAKFQADQNLVVDGIYGPVTSGALLGLLKGRWLAYISEKVGRTSLPDAELTDGAQFTRNYGALTESQQVQFWSQLILAIMAPESSYDPGEIYTEKDGTLSIGLLQLSYSDQDQYGDQGLSPANHDLMDPLKNIAFGVVIMNHLVEKNPCLSKFEDGAWQGISAYWGTMRTDNANHRAAFDGIKAKMLSITFA